MEIATTIDHHLSCQTLSKCTTVVLAVLVVVVVLRYTNKKNKTTKNLFLGAIKPNIYLKQTKIIT